jgi:hypothetical protein
MRPVHLITLQQAGAVWFVKLLVVLLHQLVVKIYSMNIIGCLWGFAARLE